MIRRALLLWPLLLALALPAHADARLSVLVDVLRLDEVAAILREEGLTSAEDLNAGMLDGQGGGAWQTQVEAIYDPARIVEAVRGALDRELDDAALEEAVAFFASDLGTRIVALENTAREAIRAPDVEEAARLRYAELSDTLTPRLEMLRLFVAGGDMVERNVTTALNSNFQFMRGLADGDALDVSEDQMLADVTAEAEAIREDTEGWLYGYLLMAYSPLTDAQLQSYIDFSSTPAGQAVNRGLFSGFGAAYEDISYALGRAVALNMTARDL
ncbi:hypothetical protein FIU94_14180 [Sulfitobacter sp. THAF37]|uniref:DUF2059 domain-containing protein n=1 Tax=Sulfitobacter sp. THAF37 TaxID=2587855 RepID=UPI00126900D6|nr:DUF2059 domain-containing protein [Sulfitobacter sp. THAF37]QFT59975.1 hypothetical protein FIU94_14180 [Sulfitobacter sp. THAF37]